jgi:RimJ/RimL family protein N-acetyltransferase
MRIRSGDLTLRAFDASLTDTVYDIRNHPTVRAQLRDPQPLACESHRRWVQENLIDARRVHLFVVLSAAQPVGIALLRNFREQAAEIGVMVVESQRRRFVAYKAAYLVSYYAFEVLGLDRLYSHVPLHHAHALAFNLHCGLEPTGPPSDLYQELVLTGARYRSHQTHARFRDGLGITVVASD